MVLSSLELQNFRSHKYRNFSFSENLNYITGGNGQGKTSILESVYYLSIGKSGFAKSDAEVVNFNADFFEIKGFFKDSINNIVDVLYFSQENKKTYLLNDKLVHRAADIIGRFPLVMLTPDDHLITQGAPGDRRKFIDSIICQASKTYLKNLLDYNKTLKQRSSLLLKLKEQKIFKANAELNAWTEKLILAGTDIIKARLKFCSEFAAFVKESYKFIMDENEIPAFSYYFLDDIFNYAAKDSIDQTVDDSLIFESFSNLISSKEKEELRRGSNLCGPHKDDFVFKIDGASLKTFGSQGQHKTFQTSLRFAEFFYLKDVMTVNPIFLLDDVFGELDTHRAARISSYLKQVGQAFITITDFTNISFLHKNESDNVLTIKKEP